MSMTTFFALLISVPLAAACIGMMCFVIVLMTGRIVGLILGTLILIIVTAGLLS